MSNTDLIKRARKKVKDKKHFYAHFNVFCVVTFSLFLINYLTTPGTWWFILPIIGWAMAVLGHYLNVFGLPSFRDRVWEEEQFEIELNRLARSQSMDIQNDKYETLDISGDELELKEPEKMREKGRTYNSDGFV